MVLTILDGLIGLGFAALVVGTIGNAMDLKETVSWRSHGKNRLLSRRRNPAGK